MTTTASPPGMVEPGAHRDFLAEIAGQVDDRYPRIAGVQRRKQRHRPVAAPVVDVDDLGVRRETIEDCGEAPVELGENGLLVVDGDDDGQ